MPDWLLIEIGPAGLKSLQFAIEEETSVMNLSLLSAPQWVDEVWTALYYFSTFVHQHFSRLASCARPPPSKSSALLLCRELQTGSAL